VGQIGPQHGGSGRTSLAWLRHGPPEPADAWDKLRLPRPSVTAGGVLNFFAQPRRPAAAIARDGAIIQMEVAGRRRLAVTSAAFSR
jgi:hypothetical protein